MNIMHLRLSHYKNCERTDFDPLKVGRLNYSQSQMDVIWSLHKKKMDLRNKRQAKGPSPSFFFFLFYHNCSLPLLQLEEDPCSRQLNGADMIKLSIKVSICYGPSIISQLWPGACMHNPLSTHEGIHPYCVFNICNLHPHLRLECLTYNQLPHSPTPQSHTKTPVILQ